MEQKRVCATCMWFQEVPFSDGICMNADSEFADCPSEDPNKDTCDEWENEEW